MTLYGHPRRQRLTPNAHVFRKICFMICDKCFSNHKLGRGRLKKTDLRKPIHIGWCDVIMHISKEKEDFCVKLNYMQEG